MRRQILFAIIGLLLLQPLSHAVAADAGVREFTLDNGMKVLVLPDHRAPVITSMVWYRVGASHEPGGMTGISHALEHMMFKGTDTLAPGEFSRIIAELGGRENAFTGRDFTAYFQQLASGHLDTALRLEADRMRNLALPEDEFVQEMRVIQEERRLRTDDNPGALAWEHFNATAWLNSPYGNPVIGWMIDIEEFTVDDLRAWYERWYAPNNALLVVVGDVDPDAVHEMARTHFGPIPARDLRPAKSRVETRQLGERRIVVRAPARVPELLMGYKVPVVNTAAEDWEPYALLVAAGILDGGGSARIPRELVRERELVVSASAGYSPFSRLDDLFVLTATPSADRDATEVERGLVEQLERLKTELVSPAELERVKAQVVARDVYRRDSIHGQAMQLGMLESIGLSWKLGEEFAERIRAVTAEQVLAVAQRYFEPDRRTVAWLDPLPIDASDSAVSMEGE